MRTISIKIGIIYAGNLDNDRDQICMRRLNFLKYLQSWIEKPFKGSPEGSSDQEFRGSILCDVIEIS